MSDAQHGLVVKMLQLVGILLIISHNPKCEVYVIIISILLTFCRR